MIPENPHPYDLVDDTVPATEQNGNVDETGFERPRGISRVDLKRGLLRVHVSKLPDPVMDHRLRVLHAIREAQVSIDFLKFTQSGCTFMAPETKADVLRQALEGLGFTFSLKANRCTVLVEAVNLRDEEGLIANLVAVAVDSGARIEHLGDMHDKLLIVTEMETAESLAERIRARFMEAKR